MSPQILVDEHLSHDDVTEVLQNWITAEQIGFELRREKGLLDEQIISLLHRLKRRTFITIDGWFYKSGLCHTRYCLIYFDLPMRRQNEIPVLLRRLFQIPGFRNIAERMGKVVKVTSYGISYRQLRVSGEQYLDW